MRSIEEPVEVVLCSAGSEWPDMTLLRSILRATLEIPEKIFLHTSRLIVDRALAVEKIIEDRLAVGRAEELFCCDLTGTEVSSDLFGAEAVSLLFCEVDEGFEFASFVSEEDSGESEEDNSFAVFDAHCAGFLAIRDAEAPFADLAGSILVGAGHSKTSGELNRLQAVEISYRSESSLSTRRSFQIKKNDQLSDP